MQNFINSQPEIRICDRLNSVLSAKKFAKGVGEGAENPGLGNIDVSSQEDVEKFGRQLAGAAAKTVGGARRYLASLRRFIEEPRPVSRRAKAIPPHQHHNMAQREMALSTYADFTDKNPRRARSGFPRPDQEADDASQSLQDVDGTILWVLR